MVTVYTKEELAKAIEFKLCVWNFIRTAVEIDRKIVELIVSNKFVTTTQMATQIGKSRQTVATRIKELQERGVVKRIGPDKGGFWEILQ